MSHIFTTSYDLPKSVCKSAIPRLNQLFPLRVLRHKLGDFRCCRRIRGPEYRAWSLVPCGWDVGRDARPRISTDLPGFIASGNGMRLKYLHVSKEWAVIQSDQPSMSICWHQEPVWISPLSTWKGHCRRGFTSSYAQIVQLRGQKHTQGGTSSPSHQVVPDWRYHE